MLFRGKNLQSIRAYVGGPVLSLRSARERYKDTRVFLASATSWRNWIVKEQAHDGMIEPSRSRGQFQQEFLATLDRLTGPHDRLKALRLRNRIA